MFHIKWWRISSFHQQDVLVLGTFLVVSECIYLLAERSFDVLKIMQCSPWELLLTNLEHKEWWKEHNWMTERVKFYFSDDDDDEDDDDGNNEDADDEDDEDEDNDDNDDDDDDVGAGEDQDDHDEMAVFVFLVFVFWIHTIPSTICNIISAQKTRGPHSFPTSKGSYLPFLSLQNGTLFDQVKKYPVAALPKVDVFFLFYGKVWRNNSGNLKFLKSKNKKNT